MQKKSRPIHWLLFLLFLFAFNPAHLFALESVSVNVRLYEGFRKKEVTKPVITTVFYLDPKLEDKPVSESPTSQEKESLKRIYNLSDIVLKTEAEWSWSSRSREKIPKLLSLSDEGENVFRIRVFEGEDVQLQDNNLLDTDIELFVGNTAIFGIEDSKERIYFLSFFRNENQSEVQNKADTTSLVPGLIRRVHPVYPEKALQEQIQGDVILEGEILNNGEVGAIKVWKGHPLLVQSSKEAFNRWAFSPYHTKKEKNQAKMVLIFVFEIIKDPESEGEINYKEIFERIKKN